MEFVQMKIKEIINEISQDTRNRYIDRATADYGQANFGARMSKNRPGLEDYNKEQEFRANKRRKGIERASSDKRRGIGEDVKTTLSQSEATKVLNKYGATVRSRSNELDVLHKGKKYTIEMTWDSDGHRHVKLSELNNLVRKIRETI